MLCLDNESIQGVIPRIQKRHTTYGMTSQADFHIRDVAIAGRRSRFNVFRKGKLLGPFTLNLPGVHNVYNATASIVVGVELDIPVERIQAALENIAGVQRRLEVKGEKNGVTVVDDYGHHPTEIKMTLDAAKACWPERRVVVVFQPHRYSRTRALLDEFTRAFYQSDVLCVLPIYAAGEDRIEGITGAEPVRGDQGTRPQAGGLRREHRRRRGPPARDPGAGGPAADPGRRRCLEGRGRGVEGCVTGRTAFDIRLTGAAA